MIRLNRAHLKVPADWQKTTRSALPDYSAFLREARRFERLDINSERRRDGFAKFAPEVLSRRAGKPYFPSIWGAAKESLANMSHDKCAYCEGEINAARAGQVEHFHPKSLFPSMAYDWDNYFLACGGCNGAKGDKWPRSGGYLRPDRQDPAGKLSFQTDGTVAAARKGSDAGLTITDFDLNRFWLVRRRKKHIELMLGRLKDMVEVYRAQRERGDRLARNEFDRLKDPANVYSAALMQCFSRGWRSACPEAPL